MRLRFATTVLLLGLAAGCAMSPPQDPFRLPREELSLKNRTIAMVSVGAPDFVPGKEEVNRKFESLVMIKLKEGKYEILPPTCFDKTWKEMVVKVGGIYDRMTGKRYEDKFRLAREHTLRELHRSFGDVLVLHANLRVVPAKMLKTARASWDGVTEEMETHGFEGTVKALSLSIVIEDTNGITLYSNNGGVQLIQKISFYGQGIPIPAEELLNRDELFVRAVDIALGPFMKASSKK